MMPRFKCPDCKTTITVPPGRAMQKGDPCPNPDCPGMAPNGRNPLEAMKHRATDRVWSAQ